MNEDAEAAGSGDGADVAPGRARNVSGEKENREEKECQRAKGARPRRLGRLRGRRGGPCCYARLGQARRPVPGLPERQVYELKNKAAVLIRIVGQTPIQALPDGTAETRYGGGK